MKIFLDTANVAEIKKGLAYGVIDGVTTNPSLVAKEQREFIPLIKEITAAIPGPVSVEVTASKPEEMIAQAELYAAIAANVVVKVPINLEGLQVVKALAGRGIKTNVTLIFSASQALLAAKAGATYVSPFVGRIDDISGDGMALVEDIAVIYRQLRDRARRSSSPRCATRCTSSRRPRSAPTWPPSPSPRWHSCSATP